jgi:hypothetical protein
MTILNKILSLFNLRRICKAINQMMTASQQVPPEFQAPFAEVESGLCGIRGLIIKILREHRATWRGDIQPPANRAAAIKAAMFMEEIVVCSRQLFTGKTIRYPKQSVKNCLVAMEKKNEVGKIQLSTDEDPDRDSCRPRFKWYLVK